MILFALLLVAFIITVVDLSSGWLDEETQNILYYDADLGSSVQSGGEDNMGTAQGQEMPEPADADSSAVKHASDAPAAKNLVDRVAGGQSVTPNPVENTDFDKTPDESFDIPDEYMLDAMLQSAFEEALPQAGSDSYGSELDEVRLSGQPLTPEEAEMDVTKLFNNFKDMI